MQVSNLIRAREKVEGFGRDTQRKLRLANQRAFDAVGQIPMPSIAPPKPDMDMSSANLQFGAEMLGTAANTFGAVVAGSPPTNPFSESTSNSFNTNLAFDSSQIPYDYQPQYNFFE